MATQLRLHVDDLVQAQGRGYKHDNVSAIPGVISQEFFYQGDTTLFDLHLRGVVGLMSIDSKVKMYVGLNDITTTLIVAETIGVKTTRYRVYGDVPFPMDRVSGHKGFKPSFSLDSPMELNLNAGYIRASGGELGWRVKEANSPAFWTKGPVVPKNVDSVWGPKGKLVGDDATKVREKTHSHHCFTLRDGAVTVVAELRTDANPSRYDVLDLLKRGLPEGYDLSHTLNVQVFIREESEHLWLPDLFDVCVMEAVSRLQLNAPGNQAIMPFTAAIHESSIFEKFIRGPNKTETARDLTTDEEALVLTGGRRVHKEVTVEGYDLTTGEFPVKPTPPEMRVVSEPSGLDVFKTVAKGVIVVLAMYGAIHLFAPF